MSGSTKPSPSHAWKRGAVRKPSAQPGRSSSSSDANRKAIKKMSEIELQTGLTPAEFEDFHEAQRARVRARWGLAA